MTSLPISESPSPVRKEICIGRCHPSSLIWALNLQVIMEVKRKVVMGEDEVSERQGKLSGRVKGCQDRNFSMAERPWV